MYIRGSSVVMKMCVKYYFNVVMQVVEILFYDMPYSLNNDSRTHRIKTSDTVMCDIPKRCSVLVQYMSVWTLFSSWT